MGERGRGVDIAYLLDLRLETKRYQSRHHETGEQKKTLTKTNDSIVADAIMHYSVTGEMRNFFF